jgi:predicted nucleotidyltransferase
MVVLLLPRKPVGEPLKFVQLKLEQLLELKARSGIRAKVEQLRLLTKMRKLGNLRLLIILAL